MYRNQDAEMEAASPQGFARPLSPPLSRSPSPTDGSHGISSSVNATAGRPQAVSMEGGDSDSESESPPASPIVLGSSSGMGIRPLVLGAFNGPGKRAVNGGKGTTITPPSSRDITPPQMIARAIAPRIVRRLQHRRRNVVLDALAQSQPASNSSPPFNVYRAIVSHPKLFYDFTTRLPIYVLVSLYAIDKEFHWRFNHTAVSLIHDVTKYHAPEAARVFNWAIYPDLCMSDPMLRPMDGRPHLARDIPTLRWSKMVVYRDIITRMILTKLALEGHRVPHQTHVVLMKFWVLMGTNTSRNRMHLIRDRSIWSDQDITFFFLFLMKLDMYFNHPVIGRGSTEMSHMLLTQKSLVPLVQVLTGSWIVEWDYDQATQMLMTTFPYNELPHDRIAWMRDESIHEIPERERGILMKEEWHPEGDRMDSPIELLTREAWDRCLDLEFDLPSFVIYGYIDEETGENIPVPRWHRCEDKVTVPKEPWPKESVRQDMIKKLDAKFGVQAPKGTIVKERRRNRRNREVSFLRYHVPQAAGEAGDAMDVDQE